MTILVSACLLGVCCRYDGKSVPCPAVLALAKHHSLIPICPEQLGGLPTPRPCAERIGDRVCNKEGVDVTEQYRRGADEALRIAQLFSCDCAILKEKSPSCGCGWVYDGSFSGNLTKGMGVCAALLTAHGISVIGETSPELSKLAKEEANGSPIAACAEAFAQQIP